MTKFQRKLYDRWQSSTIDTVRKAYKTPSFQKIKAEEKCKAYAAKHCNNQRSFRVTYATTYNFGFAYLYDESDGSIHMQYHTRDHIYDFAIDE